MEWSELLKDRYSCRKFKDVPVEEEKVYALLEAVRLAPTAKNEQPVRVTVVQNDDGLKKIDAVTRCRYGAPLVFIISYDKEKAWKDMYERNGGPVDCAIAATNLWYQATALGLNAVWVGAFDHKKCEELFHIPEGQETVCLFPVGYGDMGPSERHTKRHGLQDFVTYD